MQYISHNRDMESLSGSGQLLSFIEKTKSWVADHLPAMNKDVQAGRLALSDMATLIQPFIAEAEVLVNYEPLNPWVARMMLQPLGFPISSLEKHVQEKGYPAGAGLAALPGAENLLFWLGRMAQHPPRDSHYTNYLWNTFEQPLTYTGDPQEIFFIQAVQHTNELHADSYRALRPICWGEVDIANDNAIEAIWQAAHNTYAVRDLYRSFFVRGEDGERHMNFDFFVQFRTFKPPFPIKGVGWSGANAGNVAYQICLDCLTGTITDEHNGFIDSRLRLLTQEDQAMVASTRDLPSLLDHLLERLRLSRGDLESWSDQAVAQHVTRQGPQLQRAVNAYGELVKAAGEMSAIHWSLVKNYVIRAGESLAATSKMPLAVSDKAGLTGTSHQKLQQIMEMRRAHPLVSKLFVAHHAGQHIVTS